MLGIGTTGRDGKEQPKVKARLPNPAPIPYTEVSAAFRPRTLSVRLLTLLSAARFFEEM